MPANALVTGPPRSGKTTALERTVSRLENAGYALEGLLCPEIREGGDRVGFAIEALAADRRAVMAHVEYDGPCVGKYGVDVAAIGRLARTVLAPAVDDADCVVIDEIAPMQLESDRFVAATQTALESETPVLAAIATGSRGEIMEEVRNRNDVEIVTIDTETRDEVPRRLARWIRSRA